MNGHYFAADLNRQGRERNQSLTLKGKLSHRERKDKKKNEGKRKGKKISKEPEKKGLEQKQRNKTTVPPKTREEILEEERERGGESE